MKKIDSDELLERQFAMALKSEPEAETADCLAPERMIALAERALPEAQAALLLAHVALCSRCRREYAETAELLQLSAEVHAPQTEPQRVPAVAAPPVHTPAVESVATSSTTCWPAFLDFWRRALLPASGFALGAAVAGLALFFALTVPAQTQRDRLTAALAERNAQIVKTEQEKNRAAQELASLKRRQEDSTRLAKETERLNAQVKQQNLQIARLTASDIALQQTPLPAAVWSLRGASRQDVRGNGGTATQSPEIVLVSPVNTAIETMKPTLEYRALPNVTRVQVTLEAEGSNEELPAPRRISPTRWQATAPLLPGKVYKWAVSAQRNGRTLYSPFVKFYILSAAEKREIRVAQQKYVRSPLALGAVYARLGLREEAARQLRAALIADPNQSVAKRWLEEAQRQNSRN